MIAFGIWVLIGLIFIGLGIYAYNSNKAVGFWANSQDITLDIDDVKSYNKDVVKLWWIFGTIFILLGLPLLAGQNSPWTIISILGSIFWCIFLMGTFTKIETRYRKG